MYIPKSIRNELNALSLDVFGSASRWQKLINKGYKELVTEEVTEIVPPENEGDEQIERQVQVPIKTDFGALQFNIKRHTVESVREFLTDQKKKLDEVRALIAKQHADAKAKQDAEANAKQLHEELSGSAV